MAKRGIRPSTTVPARRKLELSQLTARTLQQEMMSPDVEIDKFTLYFSSVILMDLSGRIVDASISRTIDASSELKVTINDYDRALLTSGQLNNRLDVQIENLWFRLKGIEKQGDNLVLNFEDREIAVLRTYSKWKIANRARVTRAEFILSMIREVNEFVIPVVIPELHQIQPIQRYTDDPIGMDMVYNKTKNKTLNPKTDIVPAPKDAGNNVKAITKFHVTVKNVPITQEQLNNASAIVAVGDSMMSDTNPGKRKVIVSAIMTAITESTLRVVDHGDQAGPDSRGLFQQRASWGSLEDRLDPETSARLYYNQAIPENKKNPNEPYWELCYNVQHCRFDLRMVYQNYYQEAENIVNYLGNVGTTNVAPAYTVNGQTPKVTKNKSGDYYYWRGTIYDRNSMKFRKPENSWSCIQRLAKEVNWYAFFVSGTFYYMSEDDLLKQPVLSVITEFMDGITGIDGDYDNQKKSATLTVNARVGKWAVPPGSLVVVENMGPWNGRWIVTDYERSLFNLDATITLSKGSPSLPEPYGGDSNQLRTGWFPGTAATAPKATAGGSPGPPGSATDPVLTTDRTTLANQLLLMHSLGKWSDDNGQGLSQIQRTAAGEKLSSALGYDVWLDPKTMMVVLWLIGRGYQVGTYAWCSDHSNDGASGHAGGHAVDISSLNGHAINTDAAGTNVIAVDKLLNNTVPLEIHPRQLISGGYGGHANVTCASLCITDPVGMNPYSYYTPTVMSEHCNHIHVGY